MPWIERLSMDYGPPDSPQEFTVRAEAEEIPPGTLTGRVRFRGGDHRMVGVPQLLSDVLFDEEDGTPIGVHWTPVQRRRILNDFTFTKRLAADSIVITLNASQQADWNGEFAWNASPLKLPTLTENAITQLGDQYDALKDAGLLPQALTDEVTRKKAHDVEFQAHRDARVPWIDDGSGDD